MLSAGEIFAGYTIEGALGRGGMGAVYLARHPRLPRRVALKLLNPELFADTEIRARFEREADLVAGFDHPNIVTVYDRGADDGRLWISLQYVDGTDAAALPRPLPVERAMRILDGTAAALDHAHRKGVLHRDVKPANILLTGSAGAERVLLTDFGIARPREDSAQLTRTGGFTATLAYASPEQLSGAALDHRTDQYSLACTLFALLAGAAPYGTGNPVTVIQAHLLSPPPSLHLRRPDLPQALDAVLARALAKNPAERYENCAQFAEAVRRAVRDDGSPRRPVVLDGERAAARPVAAPSVDPAVGGAQAPAWMPPANAARPQPFPVVPAAGRAPLPVERRSPAGWIALVLVPLVLIGAGLFVWRDDLIGVPAPRGPAWQRDTDALRQAFPRLLPTSGYLNGDGFGGRRCEVKTKPGGGEDAWQQAFSGFTVRWGCWAGYVADTHYTLLTFPTPAAAAEAVERFRGQTVGHGGTTTGTRTDELRTVGAGATYQGAALVSTFAESSRDRWVLVTVRDMAWSPITFRTMEEDVAALRSDFAALPLG
ncbi:protein kinase [Nocardia thailandica]|uniref:non-specific serine/threonine protein kinase n=1 Tax=Nocardia thailandica TaxID=257275 RepID=A0ABW6PS57_9NOCA